jgi:hypothetical protein
MIDFNDFLKTLKSDLADIAKEAGEDIKDELMRDGTSFAEKLKDDLQRWTTAIVEGTLTQEELEYLLQAKKDLAQMEALKQKGLAKARIAKLKNTLISAVVGSAVRSLT